MFIEAHTHLDHYKHNELKRAIKEIDDKNIITINNSMDIPSYIKNIEISRKSKFIIPTFGIHPWNAAKYVDRLDAIEEYIYKTPMIGEIGLDFYWVKDKAQFGAQRKVLSFFLQKAKEQNKVVNLHTKGAEQEILDLLDEYKIENAIIHWYSGPKDILKNMICRNYYFTLGVEISYSDKITAIAQEIPLNRLLTETDGPGAEEWISGKRGMPILIEKVVSNLSEIKGISKEEIKQIVFENFNTLVYEKDLLKGFDR
ncbi:TatD family hydrolase [Clostridium ganghwense]|uniref:TatD family hydrolase n=1 Tax=Clostridium ganghwense TaxID=312089 RepID=A0ABT4CSF7_9CLOT|nr:TatD family hydrolase [Clostridium ganghwense]MCY6372004.1 TatD family hydrolase [Clostridium ganghwense]